MGFQYLGPGITVLSPSDPRPPQYVSIRSSFWQAVAAAALGWAVLGSHLPTACTQVKHLELRRRHPETAGEKFWIKKTSQNCTRNIMSLKTHHTAGETSWFPLQVRSCKNTERSQKTKKATKGHHGYKCHHEMTSISTKYLLENAEVTKNKNNQSNPGENCA